jgi:chaperone modulatory protein CbpM
MIINRLELIQRAQIEPHMLDVWLREDWLLPNAILTDMEFSEVDLARAVLIRDLTQDLGINDEGVGVILHLVDQVHGLRQFVSALLPANDEQQNVPPETSEPL